MITTIAEFEEASAFETYILHALLPVISQNESCTIDLRGEGVRISHYSTTSLSTAAVNHVKNDLSPLMFGAAWKVLDLALELMLNNSEHKSASKKKWKIAEKQKLARQGSGNYQMLTTDQAVWRAVAALYASTVEHRHCLVHRAANIDPDSGSFTGVDQSSRPLLSLSLEQQKNIAHIASLVASGIKDGGITRRNKDYLQYFLDTIQAHSGHQRFGVKKPTYPEQILTMLGIENGQYVLDIAAAAKVAAQRSPHTLHFNVVFDVPDDSSRKLKAALENIPLGKHFINLDSLPAWLSSA